MSINPLTFGSPVYSPPFSVSPGDTGVMKLRSMETAPLSHESLDENFTNLANKINEILGLNIDEVNITSDGIISPANLGISAGSGLLLSASGVFTHQARPARAAGYENVDISTSNRRFISGLDFDEFGHVVGYQDRTLNFTGSGSVSVDQSSVNQVTISSSAYTSGSSPSFGNIAGSKLTIGSGVELRESVHRADLLEICSLTSGWGGIQIKNNTSEHLWSLMSDGESFGLYDDASNEWSWMAKRSGELKVLYEGNTVFTTNDSGVRIHQQAGKTIGGNNLSQASLLVGSTTAGIGIDDNEIIKKQGTNGGDLNIGSVGSSSAIKLKTGVNSSGLPYNRMVITSAGNVGIGKEIPSALLDVTGSLDQLNSASVENTSATGYGLVTKGGGNGKTRYIADFRDKDNSSALKIDGDGNVGIGTTSPDRLMHLASNAAIICIEDTAGATDDKRVQIQVDDGKFEINSRNDDNSSRKDNIFVADLGTSNVGIGTPAPQELLTIRGTGTSDYNAIRTSLGGGNENLYYTEWIAASGFKVHRAKGTSGNLNIGIDTPPSDNTEFTGTGGNIGFSTNSEGTYGTRLMITKDGDVGIGTTNPQGKLEINHTGSWNDPSIHLKGDYPTIKFNDTNASEDDWYIHVNNNNFNILVDRGASGDDSPIGDANNVWETPHPLVLEGDNNKGYLFGSQIVTKEFTGDLNVSGTLSTDTLSIKSGAIYMWHRTYAVSNTSFQELKMEDGSDLATGGVYRVTAHIPSTGTHTGATAVYWNNNGKWYCNQTTGAGGSSNHIGFIVLSDGRPAIRTWHATGYSVSVYHERMYLGENDTENTSALFGCDGIISKPPGEDNLYYNRYTSETGLGGGSFGQKILKSSHVYNNWDVFLHENSGMLMSYTGASSANHWFGGNVTYDSSGFKARYEGQVVWGKYDSNPDTSVVHALYATRATADNQVVSTTDNQVLSVNCDFNSQRKKVSIYAGFELLLNEQDVETSHTKHGDWFATYNSSHTRDVLYNRSTRQTELKGVNSSDVTTGATHKAVRVPPGCKRFRVSILAYGTNNRSNGFYIGAAELDSELPVGKLAISHNASSGDNTVQEDTRYQWLRNNGNISSSRQLYTYEFEVANTCKWFSIFMLNWTGMSTDTLYFDPDIKIEPIYNEFGQSQGLAYADFSVRNSSGNYSSGLTWVGSNNSYANYTWHRQGGHVHLDIQIHRKVALGISNIGFVAFNGLPFPAYKPAYSGGYNNTTYSNGGSHGIGVRTWGNDFVHFNTSNLAGTGVLTMECPSGDLTNGSTTGTIRGSVDYMTDEY
jgi:hypothetical protein